MRFLLPDPGKAATLPPEWWARAGGARTDGPHLLLEDLLSEEKVMEVLEAYDLTQSYRSAGLLRGVDPRTVAEPFADKAWEWIDHSRARIRADVAHPRLLTMGR